jgi:putative NAD(P)H nitroreductase
MIGFNEVEVRKFFNVPKKYEIALLITMGKEDTTKRRMRGYRKPIAEFVTKDNF